ncbi:tigger transposable element-derived protein 1-like [Palaemon carinicauda]|uniref:tigger transposable element-derived protein 1-like n=1 Tax=Palaemon carinicauda TaxID=392227 RepID=UPI0035B60F20
MIAKEYGRNPSTITEAIIFQKASVIFYDFVRARAEADTGEGISKQAPTQFNASRGCCDIKVKPLLVYHSDTPRAFKAHKVIKENLQLLWWANAKAWITRHWFTNKVNVFFAPTVKKYLEEKRLPLRYLLMLDNAPAHLSGLEENILAQYSFLKVFYLPPNATPLLQPMVYLAGGFKVHFELCWKKLWPDAISSRDFKGFYEGQAEDKVENVDDPEAVAQSEVAEIVTLEKKLSLEFDEADINELIEEHQEELRMDDLKELESMQLNKVQEQLHSSEGEENDPLTTTEVKEGLADYYKMVALLEKSHPEIIITGRWSQFCFIQMFSTQNSELSMKMFSPLNRGKSMDAWNCPGLLSVVDGTDAQFNHARLNGICSGITRVSIS